VRHSCAPPLPAHNAQSSLAVLSLMLAPIRSFADSPAPDAIWPAPRKVTPERVAHSLERCSGTYIESRNGICCEQTISAGSGLSRSALWPAVAR
jgi:hypothetical protein